jgi:hypothetical protein
MGEESVRRVGSLEELENGGATGVAAEGARGEGLRDLMQPLEELLWPLRVEGSARRKLASSIRRLGPYPDIWRSLRTSEAGAGRLTARRVLRHILCTRLHART